MVGIGNKYLVSVGTSEALPMVMVAIWVCYSSREGIWSKMNLSVHIIIICMLSRLLIIVTLVLHL